MKVLRLIPPLLIIAFSLAVFGRRASAPIQEAAQAQTSQEAVYVQTVTPSQKNLGSITALGTVRPLQTTRLVASTPGQVVKKYVEEGATVSSGQILFELGGLSAMPHPLALQLELARQNYENSLRGLEAVYEGNELALRTLNQQAQFAAPAPATPPQLIANNGSVPHSLTSDETIYFEQDDYRAALLKNESTLLQTRSQADGARIGYEMAKVAYEGLRIRAPFSGVVEEFTVQVGDLVGPQLPVATITSVNGFELSAMVTPEDASRITPGVKATVFVGENEVTASVKKIAIAVDPASRLVEVTLRLPKINARINQNFSARIPLTTVKGFALYVPLDAVSIGTDETYLFVYEDGIARKRAVKLGAVEGDRASILDSLVESEKVILNSKLLIDGQPVTLAPL